MVTILLLIVGCQKLEGYNPPEDRTGEVHYDYQVCSIDYFVIEPVDELIPSNCYAMRTEQLAGWELDVLNKSLKYVGLDSFEILQITEPSKVCRYVNTWNSKNHISQIFCLKDNSSCLFVDSSGICTVVDLK